MTVSPEWLWWVAALCFGYLTAIYGWSMVLLVASIAEHRDLMVESQGDDDVVALSAFTIPVSVIAPVHNEGDAVVGTVQSLLDLEYHGHEVIVVNDGSTDETLQHLTTAFLLEARTIFHRRSLDTQAVRGIYVSRSHRNLTVIDKEQGGKADALNCAVNLSRYQYVCTTDGDTIYRRDALRKGMRPVHQNPALVVGVSAAVGIHRHPEQMARSHGSARRIDRDLLTNFQLLDFLRSFLTARLGATRWHFMLCASGAFAVWRRDLVLQLGGFSSAFTCEDIEFTFRAHETLRRARVPYRIVSLGTLAGTTEGPPRARDLVSQRARWQRVILETVWSYRYMFLNPRYGSVGTVGVPHYVLTEVLAPMVQLLALAVSVLAWRYGLFDGRALQLVLIVALANGVLTNAALLVHDVQSRAYRVRDLVRLILLGPLDLFLYRPLIFVAQTKGFVDFVRGRKGWDKFARHGTPAG